MTPERIWLEAVGIQESLIPAGNPQGPARSAQPLLPEYRHKVPGMRPSPVFLSFLQSRLSGGLCHDWHEASTGWLSAGALLLSLAVQVAAADSHVAPHNGLTIHYMNNSSCHITLLPEYYCFRKKDPEDNPYKQYEKQKPPAPVSASRLDDKPAKSTQSSMLHPVDRKHLCAFCRPG